MRATAFAVALIACQRSLAGSEAMLPRGLALHPTSHRLAGRRARAPLLHGLFARTVDVDPAVDMLDRVHRDPVMLALTSFVSLMWFPSTRSTAPNRLLFEQTTGMCSLIRFGSTFAFTSLHGVATLADTHTKAPQGPYHSGGSGAPYLVQRGDWLGRIDPNHRHSIAMSQEPGIEQVHLVHLLARNRRLR